MIKDIITILEYIKTNPELEIFIRDVYNNNNNNNNEDNEDNKSINKIIDALKIRNNYKHKDELFLLTLNACQEILLGRNKIEDFINIGTLLEEEDINAEVIKEKNYSEGYSYYT